jgi:undecaprenyl-diphosphatase
MNILQPILEGDQCLFRLINGGMSNPIFDVLLPLFRERLFWVPFYLFIVSFTLLNTGNKKWVILLGLVVTVGLTDATSSRVIKKNVQRIRPCNATELMQDIRLRVPCGGGYSFTSSHAANHFAVAVFLIVIFGLSGQWQQKAMLVWAGTIAFSQVYVGVHYPLDVFMGALLGSIIGWSVSKLLLKLLLTFFQDGDDFRPFLLK